MKKPWRILVALFMVVMAGLACQWEEAVQADPNILFRDDFSDPTSGWNRYGGVNGVTDYYEGGYRILVMDQQYDYWSNPGKNLGDVRIEVTATKLAGPDENVFGIICRYQNEMNFYSLFVGNDGSYGVIKVKDGEQGFVGSDGFDFSEVIIKGDGAVNKVQADCVENFLRLGVNDTILITTQDNEFSSGDVGLLAGTFEEVGVDILFDNFVVRKP